MTVNLSLLGGAGWQFFTDNGTPLAGGLLYTYLAGTSTAATTYTTSAGNVPNSNPIVLNSAGRVQTEIWLTQGVSYKFVLKTSAFITIGTYDNIDGAADPADIYAALAASSGSSLVGFIQSGSGAVATTVQAKLRESVSVMDFGADPSASAAANYTAITAAIAAADSIYIPAGTYSYDTTLVVPNRKTIFGANRETTILSYTGTGDGIQIGNNAVNSSGTGSTTLRDFFVICTNGANTGAGISLNAGGFAFYEIDQMHSGNFKYGITLDQAEVSHVHRSIFEPLATGYGIWLLNDDARRVGANLGFGNVITIQDNQINGGLWSIVDDGGNDHTIVNNNCNAPSVTAIRMCGATSFTLNNNSMESGGATTATSNMVFGRYTLVKGLDVGPCLNGQIKANTFAMDQDGTQAMLRFATDWQTGIEVSSNYFRSSIGRIGAIDVTKLSNSFCGFNFDSGIVSSGTHYVGQHRGVQGNILYPPQNTSGVTDVNAPYEFGDTGRVTIFYGGQTNQSGTYIKQTGPALAVDTTYGTINCDYAGTVTLTMLSAASWSGRILNVRTVQAQTVVSNASNVIPLAGGAAGTAILAATAGKWATLQSDGTNWQIIAAN